MIPELMLGCLVWGHAVMRALELVYQDTSSVLDLPHTQSLTFFLCLQNLQLETYMYIHLSLASQTSQQYHCQCMPF